MDKLKKEKKWIVIINLLFIAIMVLGSCHSQTINKRKYTDVSKDNCGKFTLNYSERHDTYSDSVLIYGKVIICATGEKASNATILITDEAGKKFEAKADNKGSYKLRVAPGFNKIYVRGNSAYLEIPYTYLGDHGNLLEMNLDLIRVPILDDSYQDKSLEKELRNLKKK